ncbi:MAG: DoxX family protein [Actinomycetes bacterium]
MFGQMVDVTMAVDHSHMYQSDAMVNGLNLGLLIIRVIVGFTLATHGLNKIFGGGKIPGTTRWFASMGMKMPKANAWIAALTEIGSGALLILGLLTPLAAAGLVAITLVALITSHLNNGWFVFKPGQGIEYVLVLAMVGIGLACTGPGQWSVDHAAEIHWAGVPSGLIIVLVAGVGGALLQLATFWRPKSVASN